MCALAPITFHLMLPGIKPSQEEMSERDALNLFEVLKAFCAAHPNSVQEVHKLLSYHFSSFSRLRRWLKSIAEELATITTVDSLLQRLLEHLAPIYSATNGQARLKTIILAKDSPDSLPIHADAFFEAARTALPPCPSDVLWAYTKESFFNSIEHEGRRDKAKLLCYSLTSLRDVRLQLAQVDKIQPPPTSSSSNNSGRSRHVSGIGGDDEPTFTRRELESILDKTVGAVTTAHQHLFQHTSSGNLGGSGSSSTNGGGSSSGGKRRTNSGKGGGQSHYGPASSSSAASSPLCFCCGHDRTHFAPGHRSDTCNTHPDAFVPGYSDREKNVDRFKSLQWKAIHTPHLLVYPDLPAYRQQQAQQGSGLIPAASPPIVPTSSTQFRTNQSSSSEQRPPTPATPPSLDDAAARLVEQHLADHGTHPARRAALVSNLFQAAMGRPNGQEPPAGFNH